PRRTDLSSRDMYITQMKQLIYAMQFKGVAAPVEGSQGVLRASTQAPSCQANEITGARRVLICAGQLATDADGHLLHARDMRAQIGQSLDNLETVLKAAGMGLGDVVRLNFYTTDVDALMEAMADFSDRLTAANCRPASTLLGV